MKERYGDTRLGRQELNGELIEDDPDALFKRDLIESDAGFCCARAAPRRRGGGSAGGLRQEEQRLRHCLRRSWR